MRKIILPIVALLLLTAPAQAQNEMQSISEGISQLWKKTKKAINKTTQSIKEEFNIDEAGAELLEIDGHKYMPIYINDIFKGSEGDEFKETCRQQFLEKYSSVELLSCVIPQEDWTDKNTFVNGKVSKYLKLLYCYVLAKDGDDGYIQARFVFRKKKPVGGTWTNDEDYWPLWNRTDVMVPSVYEKLKKHQK